MHGKSNHAAVVEGVKENNSSVVVSSPVSHALSGRLGQKTEFLKQLGLATLVGSLLFGAVVVAFRSWQPGSSVQITKVTRLSRDGLVKMGLATDGANIYFSEYLDGRIQLSWMHVGGGPIGHIATPFSQAFLQDVLADGGELLVEGRDGKEQEAALWIVPVNGRPLWRVGAVACHSAARSPDGKLAERAVWR
jgi:hypothetical protein